MRESQLRPIDPVCIHQHQGDHKTVWEGQWPPWWSQSLLWIQASNWRCVPIMESVNWEEFPQAQAAQETKAAAARWAAAHVNLARVERKPELKRRLRRGRENRGQDQRDRGRDSRNHGGLKLPSRIREIPKSEEHWIWFENLGGGLEKWRNQDFIDKLSKIKLN